MSCRSTRDWLHRDAASLPDGDRLVLEDHLQACATCRRERALLLQICDAVRTLPSTSIGPRGFQRAIARAMLEATPAIDANDPPRARWWWLAVPAVALAVALVVWWTRGEPPVEHAVVMPDPRVDTARDPEPPPTPKSQITRGSVAGLSAGSELPADTELHTTAGASITLPAVRASLGAETSIRWEVARRTLHLRNGVVDVDVDPAGRLPFSVVTTRFTVAVVGTSFQVTASRVSVTRGAVRITAPDGTLLVEKLAAGENWELPADPPPPPRTTARSHLAFAHRAFAAKDWRLAESHADAALDAGPSRVEIAEARTILAECAQATGRLDEAIRRYDAIVARFADLATVETALIATARLEASRGRADAARARYRRYLDRYPSGRFADDARRQLGR